MHDDPFSAVTLVMQIMRRTKPKTLSATPLGIFPQSISAVMWATAACTHADRTELVSLVSIPSAAIAVWGSWRPSSTE